MTQSELIAEPFWVSKEVSPKQAVRYHSRIIHQIQPIQKQLATTLEALKETTGDYIEYIPLGRLGVTLATLDPVLKQILGTDKKGEISNPTRRDFEAELNEEFEAFRGRTIQVDSAPETLGVYGTYRNRLGINLSPNDGQLFGERVLMERYIRSEYPAVSPRFGDEIVRWEPHVTIGMVRPEKFNPRELEEFYDEPSEFIFGLAEKNARENQKRFGIEDVSDRIIFPEELSLGGLKVVCDKQATRAF